MLKLCVDILANITSRLIDHHSDGKEVKISKRIVDDRKSNEYACQLQSVLGGGGGIKNTVNNVFYKVGLIGFNRSKRYGAEGRDNGRLKVWP